MRISMYLASTLLIFSTTSTAAFADCVAPQEPGNIPNAATATDADMLAAQHAVKQYLAAMEQHLKCLGESGSNYNASIEQMESVAARFNSTVRAFKSKHTTS